MSPSPSAQGDGLSSKEEQTAKEQLHKQVEREMLRKELEHLEGQLPTTSFPEQTQAAIDDLRRELDLDPVAA